jgi:hypothetical protein
VWRQDTVGNAVPVARPHRERALPDAWWRTGIWWPSRNGNYWHGRYTAEAIASRRWLSSSHATWALTKTPRQP